MTRTKPIWWLISILLTSIGWVAASAIFIAIFEFPRWVNINTGIIYLIFMWFVPGAIGGLITVTAMRIVIPGIQWKQALFVIIGWAIALAIGRLTNLFTSFYPIWWFGFPLRWFSIGAIGGLITVTAMRKVIPGIQWKQALFVTIGWIIGWVIGGAIIVATIGRNIGGIAGFVIGYGIGWTIAGAIGGGVMFLMLHRAKQSA